MLTFDTGTIADKEWITQLLALEPTRACEYNFPTIHLWGRTFQKEIARCGDRLVVRMHFGGEICYLYPVGGGALQPVLEEMKRDAQNFGVSLRLICVTDELCCRLEESLPGGFRFEPDRDAYDYIYGVDKLADLKGKKLHAKRNHINRFLENHPDWSFEVLSRENLTECLRMDEVWVARRDEKLTEVGKRQLGYETDAVKEAVEHFDMLGLDGGLIRTGGQVVAFSIGSRTGEGCYNIHFEKAFDYIQGSYAMINREVARYIRARYPGVTWINREDDMGIEGLRKVKMSYCPDLLLKKYTAILAD